MSSYLSMTGVVSQIQPSAVSGSGTEAQTEQDCCLSLTLQTYYQGTVLFTFTGDTYVLDNETIRPGDQLTVFYDRDAPVLLIYPPTYQAVLLAKSSGRQFYLGQFNDNFVSTDNALQLTVDPNTPVLLPNGQVFSGNISGKTVLAEYQASTRSIPAQTTPDLLIVFC